MPEQPVNIAVETAAALAAAATIAAPEPAGLDPTATSPRIAHHRVPADRQWHGYALAGPILHVGGRASDVVEFWALHHPDGLKRYRHFRAFATDEPLPGAHRYIGTVVHGTIAWHLIERLT